MKESFLKLMSFIVCLTLVAPQVVLAATAATGSITGVSRFNFSFNETMTLHDGTASYPFFLSNLGGSSNGRCKVNGEGTYYYQPCDSGDQTVIDTGGGASESTMVDRFVYAINTTTIGITATANDLTVDLVNDTAGTAGNQDITETVADSDFVVSGMSGGTDADAVPEFTDYLYLLTLGAGAWYIYSRIAQKNNNIQGGAV